MLTAPLNSNLSLLGLLIGVMCVSLTTFPQREEKVTDKNSSTPSSVSMTSRRVAAWPGAGVKKV